jgi:hypothetical protein
VRRRGGVFLSALVAGGWFLWLAAVRDNATIKWAATTALAAAVCLPAQHIVWEWGRRQCVKASTAGGGVLRRKRFPTGGVYMVILASCIERSQQNCSLRAVRLDMAGWRRRPRASLSLLRAPLLSNNPAAWSLGENPVQFLDGQRRRLQAP